MLSVSLGACNNTGERTASRHETPLEAIPAKDTALQQPHATGDNSQNSLDWAGTYEATLPCADCPGIKTILVLTRDNTFNISSTYLEDHTRSTVTEDKGTMTWQDNGGVIHLKGKETDLLLRVGENRLFQLDRQGKEIDGTLKEHYMYTKK